MNVGEMRTDDARLPFSVRHVPVVAAVLAREPIDLVVGAFFRERRRAGDPEPAQLVGRIDDDERHARIGGEVARLGPGPRRVDRYTVVVDVDPQRGRMRRAVGTKGRHDADVRVLEERPLRRRELLHEMATIRSIAPRARSAISSGTVTSYFQSRSESRSFGSVIIFM